MKTRIRRALSAVLTALAVLTLSLAAGCSDPEDYPRRLDTASGTAQTTAAPQGDEFLQPLAAPRVVPGKYKMVTSSLQSLDYSMSGVTYLSASQEMIYTYNVEVRVADSGSVNMRFAFDRAQCIISQSGERQEGSFDTKDKDTKNSESEVWFDLIGKVFTADFDKSLEISSVSGVSDILAKNPEAKYLISEENLSALAAEVIFPLPESLSNGVSFTRRQTITEAQMIDVIYTVQKLRSGKLGLAITTEAETVLPEDEDDAETGYTVRYKKVDPFTGMLWVSTENRMLQESTKSVKYYSEVSSLDSSTGETTVFDCVTTICNTSAIAAG